MLEEPEVFKNLAPTETKAKSRVTKIREGC